MGTSQSVVASIMLDEMDSSTFAASVDALGPKEMDKLNAELAQAIMQGKLNENPFMHGLLSQCLATLEKRERGIATAAGRPASCSFTKWNLLQDVRCRMIHHSWGYALPFPRVRHDRIQKSGMLRNLGIWMDLASSWYLYVPIVFK